MAQLRQIDESSIEKTARMLTSRYGVNVVFSGSTACTDGKTITLPAATKLLPEDKQQILAGYLDHEAAHVIFSEFKHRARAKDKAIANAIEDIRVEREMVKEWSGTRANFEHVSDFFFEGVKKNWDNLDSKCKFLAELMERERGNSFNDKRANYLHDKCSDLITRVATVDSESEAVDLSDEISARLDEIFEEEKKQREEEKKRQEEAEKKKEKQREKESKEDEQEDKGSGAEKDSEEEEDEEESDSEDLEDEDEDDSADAEEDYEDAAGEDDGDEHEDGEDDSEADDGDDEQAGGGSSSDEEDEEDDSEPIEDEKSLGGGGLAEEEERSSITAEQEDGTVAEDEEGKVDKLPEHSEALSQLVQAAMSNMEVTTDKYIPYTTDGDIRKRFKVAPHRKEGYQRDYKALKDSFGSELAALSSKVRRLLMSEAEVRYEYGKNRGRIDGRRAYRLATGVGKDIFKQKYQHRDPSNTVVSIVMDESCSMRLWGDRATAALKATLLVAEVLDNCQYPFSIEGHTTGSFMTGQRRHFLLSSAEAAHYSRYGDMRIRTYKEFDDNWKTCKLDVMQYYEGSNYNAYDGEMVLHTANMLLQRPERRKIMFVMTDGSPECNVSSCNKKHSKYLKDIVKEVEKNTEIEIVAFGIMSDHVELFYDKSVVISSVGEIPAKFLEVCTKILMKKERRHASV